MYNEPRFSPMQMPDSQYPWEMSPFSSPRTIPVGWEVSALCSKGKEEGTKEQRDEGTPQLGESKRN